MVFSVGAEETPLSQLERLGRTTEALLPQLERPERKESDSRIGSLVRKGDVLYPLDGPLVAEKA